MVNPVSSAYTAQASEAAQSAAPKPQQTQQSPRQPTPQPSDTVTLNSTAGADQTGSK
ncbi:MAG: hypothetical protein WA252_10800 [Candidatus Sulfotelmatobacter sp.]